MNETHFVCLILFEKIFCGTADKEEEEAEVGLAEQVPVEVMMKILSHLSPRDLSRCAQVSQRWNQLAMDPSLWRAIHPVQWAQGEWGGGVGHALCVEGHLPRAVGTR